MRPFISNLYRGIISRARPATISSPSLIFGLDGDTSSTTITRDITGKTVNSTGAVSVVSSASPSGSKSIQFNGGVLVVPTNTSWAVGTGDWTFETYLKSNSAATASGIFSKRNPSTSGTNTYEIGQNFQGAGKYYITTPVADSGYTITNGGTVTNTWKHIAFVRRSANIYIFVDGIQVATAPCAFDHTNIYDVALGARTVGGAQLFIGLMDRVRFWGYARYTANFTPPVDQAIA